MVEGTGYYSVGAQMAKMKGWKEKEFAVTTVRKENDEHPGVVAGGITITSSRGNYGSVEEIINSLGEGTVTVEAIFISRAKKSQS